MLAFNTKATGYLGLALSLLGLLTYGPFQEAVLKALPASIAAWVGPVFIVIGAAAAYFGMPATVPTSNSKGT